MKSIINECRKHSDGVLSIFSKMSGGKYESFNTSGYN
ncbi:hypothetical protein J2Z76_000571 [Sedimentibacter acidaminivorans]|uniref:Uncharacterized protein n=1 Tax=Sedimentibacter acidaminivorans TaxID=913099 RepID=A0ABS4GAK4_9FIRM|nr:hypothetical protein [Sedimentibacter acidaminivorans]